MKCQTESLRHLCRSPCTYPDEPAAAVYRMENLGKTVERSERGPGAKLRIGLGRIRVLIQRASKHSEDLGKLRHWKASDSRILLVQDIPPPRHHSL